MQRPRPIDHAKFAIYPLHPVALEIWQGFVFINLAQKPQPFADALPALVGKFAHRKADALKSAHRKVYEIDANWKLIFHNFSECYHCPTVHPQLNRLTPFRNTENDLDEGPVLGGPMWMTNPEGSMTIGGARCAAPFEGLSAEERARVYYYTVFPSGFISFHPDYVMLHRALPIARGHTRVVCEWFFHPDAIAAPGFDPMPAVEFWDITNRQDWAICEQSQLGIASSRYEPGPYSEMHEGGVIQFVDWYARFMEPRLAEGEKPALRSVA